MPHKEEKEDEDYDNDDEEYYYEITWRKDDDELEYTFDFEPEKDLRQPMVSDTVSTILDALAKQRQIIGGTIIRIREMRV